MKGGYKLIDFKKVDITEEDVVIDGIFNSINSTTKRVVATNLNIGGFELKELELSVVGDESGYVLQCPFLNISINDEDGVSCEVFTSENSSNKKIYCHPIRLTYDGTNVTFRLTCLIFNNDSTPFTLETFKEFLDKLNTESSGSASIMLSGGYNNYGTVVIATSIRNYQGTYNVNGINTSGNSSSITSSLFSDVIPNTTILNDGVNAIN